MKRKGFWFSGLALAALLAVSDNAQAGVWAGLRVGRPALRHEVVVAHPGRFWGAGYRGWDRVRSVWLPGRWIARRAGPVWVDGRWGHRFYGRAHREGYRRRR